MSNSNSFKFDQPRLRSSWSTSIGLFKGPLTDRKIAKYQAQGYYSAELKAARRDFAAKKAARQSSRDGSFIKIEGRLIYNPSR